MLIAARLWLIGELLGTITIATSDASLTKLESDGNVYDDPRVAAFSLASPESSSSPSLSYDRVARAARDSIRRSCAAPRQPDNGEWRLHEVFCETGTVDCKVPENTELGLGYQLIYTCKPGHAIKGGNVAYCGPRGAWSHVPSCEEIRCEPLNTVSRIGRCFRSQQNVDCDLPVVPKTQAEVSCRPGYNKDTTVWTPSKNVLTCNENGSWEPQPIRCVPVCGRAATRQRPYSVNGWNANIGDFPWHATLYLETKSGRGITKNFVCGATIIQADLVMTAAHCVHDETIGRTIDAAKLFVMTGNTYRDWDHPSHGTDVVKRAVVRRVIVPFNYYGLRGNYASDIALLELATPFVFSAILLPACLDNSDNNAPILEPNNYGKVAGFGVTSAGETSPVLQTITLPYVAYGECKASANAFANEVFITKDKFCAGYTNGSAVCDGDSGGGLVFQRSEKWYVMGIVSVGLGVDVNNGARTCDKTTYTLFTKVSEHVDWLLNAIYDVNQRKLQSTSNNDPEKSSTSENAPRTTGSADRPDPAASATECGRADDLEGLTRIAIPWYAAVYVESNAKEETRKKLLCGATIVHEKLLLAAAHCVYYDEIEKAVNPAKLFVTVGSIYPEYDSPLQNTALVQKRQVRNITLTRSYHGKKGYEADIALLHLERPLTLNKFIRPACLYEDGDDAEILDVGRHGTLIGFGRNSNDELTGTLEIRDVPYIAEDECRTASTKSNIFISRYKFCAGHIKGSTACSDVDDYGGLMFQKNDRWYVMGVPSVALRIDSSTGEKLCDKFSDVIYTRLSRYLPHIRALISGLD